MAFMNPFTQFKTWLTDAEANEPNDPNAMSLATVGADGMPANRMVLLKDLDSGFVFYTNKTSRKADDLAANPRAALCFHWKSLRKQVRVQGLVEHVSDDMSEAYFRSRSRQSQLGAIASDQSSILEDRESFMRRYQQLVQQYGDKRDETKPIPRPAHWGGYRVVPLKIEFWQDGEHRLHDRMVYQRETPDSAWATYKLYP